MKRNISRPREERNSNDQVNRNLIPKIHQYDGAKEPTAFNAGDNGEVISAAEPQDLAQLVWKYFENEIRETMIEVQQAIQAEQSSSTGQISQRKQKRK